MSLIKAELKYIALHQLKRSRFQPRVEFAPELLQELAQSIRYNGVIQPLVVRPSQGYYEILAGERRWRASQLAGLDSIPCLIRPYNDEEAAAVTAIENINRVDLNPIEKAMAYQNMISQFHYSHEELSAIVGESRSKITNALRLLNLEPQIQEWIIEGQLSEGHGKVLAGLTPMQQKRLAEKAVKHQWSVRQVEKEAQKLYRLVTSSNSIKDANLESLEQKLADFLGCPVTLNWHKNKGQMLIEFYDTEIFNGLLARIGFELEN